MSDGGMASAGILSGVDDRLLIGAVLGLGLLVWWWWKE